jgi:hypothetical protein
VIRKGCPNLKLKWARPFLAISAYQRRFLKRIFPDRAQLSVNQRLLCAPLKRFGRAKFKGHRQRLSAADAHFR